MIILATGIAESATVTGSFNKTYALVNDTTQYINLTYLQSVSNATVEFKYGAAGGGNFDNSGGGSWAEYFSFPITTVPAEYAQYRISINGQTWEIYSADGTLQTSGTNSNFWSLVKSDGSDIRVFNQNFKTRTNYSDYQLYFYIENFDVVSQIATIWVNVSANSQELNIAYGNPSATKSSYNDISLTFEFGDDFTGTLDSNKWYVYAGSVSISNGVLTLSGGTVKVHSKTYFTGDVLLRAKIYYDDVRAFGFAEESSDNINFNGDLAVIKTQTSIGVDVENEGGNQHLESATLSQNSWNEFEIIWNLNNGLTIKENGVSVNSNMPYMTGYPDGIPGIPIYMYVYSGDSNTLLKVDYIFVAKLTDPADFGTPSVKQFATPAQNPKLYLNNNLAASYNGILNDTVVCNYDPQYGEICEDYRTSGKIAITDYWTAGNNNLYFVADSGNFNAVVTFDYVLNVTEQRVETFDYIMVNTSFWIPNGTTSATWQTSFTTNYNYSVKVYINGAETYDFTLSEVVNPDNSTTVTISVPLSVNGSVSVDVYVNFVATGVRVTVLDELSKTGLSGITVQILDKNYNLIKEGTTDATGLAVLQTVYFGNAYLRAKDANGVTRQIELIIPNGGSVNATIYFPTSNVVQIVFEIRDLTGQFPSPELQIKKFVSREELVTIHTDKADTLNHVQAYLITSESYQLYLVQDGQVRSLGYYIPTSAKTEILYVTSLNASAEVYNNIKFHYYTTFENNSTKLIVEWETLKGTTSYVNLSVKNSTGGLFYYAEATNPEKGRFTVILGNDTYEFTFYVKNTEGDFKFTGVVRAGKLPAGFKIPKWIGTLLFTGLAMAVVYMGTRTTISYALLVATFVLAVGDLLDFADIPGPVLWIMAFTTALSFLRGKEGGAG